MAGQLKRTAKVPLSQQRGDLQSMRAENQSEHPKANWAVALRWCLPQAMLRPLHARITQGQ